MERKTNQTTWWDILAIIVVCLLVGIAGARAQSYEPTIDTGIIYRIGDYMPLPYKLNPTYELDEISAITHPVDYPFTPIKSGEYHIGTPWIAERDKSTIIEYLMNLIAELMEPGEMITIKKVKE